MAGEHNAATEEEGECCREEVAGFCEHNIRCFRPILTGRGRQEAKRPRKWGGGGDVLKEREEKRIESLDLG